MLYVMLLAIIWYVMWRGPIHIYIYIYIYMVCMLYGVGLYIYIYIYTHGMLCGMSLQLYKLYGMLLTISLVHLNLTTSHNSDY